MNEEYTYLDAFEELQTIVSDIERGEISIDELSQKVKRAALLINVCKAKLTSTENEVNDILADLASNRSSERLTSEEHTSDGGEPLPSPDEEE